MPGAYSMPGAYCTVVLYGIAKRQKQEEVWDLWDKPGEDDQLNPMATALQYSYAKLLRHTLGPQNSGLCSIRIWKPR